MQKGKIVQVFGPVVDVAFSDGNLPMIKDALTVDNHGRQAVMEVPVIWATILCARLC